MKTTTGKALSLPVTRSTRPAKGRKDIFSIFAIATFFLLPIIPSACTALSPPPAMTVVPNEQRTIQMAEQYRKVLTTIGADFLANQTEDECSFPSPYKGNMVFRSKYEGSGSSRDVVNKAALQDYHEATASILEFQKLIAQKTDKIIKAETGSADLSCVLEAIIEWSEESDLLHATEDHTGRSMRKWTLAALSANLLEVDGLARQYEPEKYNRAKAWITAMAEQVMTEWHNVPEVPLAKINNHEYWAAWAVMASGMLLDREDMFSWAEAFYATAMAQITDEGYLPNELARKSRAALYHNYATLPLVGMAFLLDANNRNPFDDNNGALARLCSRVISTLDDTTPYENKTGVAQVEYDLTQKGRLAWIPFYLFIGQKYDIGNVEEIAEVVPHLDSFSSTRLGGDIRFLVTGQQ